MANAQRRSNWFKHENEGSRNQRREQQPIAPWHASVPSVSEFGHDIENLFHNAFHPFGWPSALASMTRLWSPRDFFHPNVNIASTDEEYTVTVEVPGMEENDVRLEVSPSGMLTIVGEKRQETTDKHKDYQYMESSYGTFRRTLTLPEDVNRDQIEANFKNGILTIMCPRTGIGKSYTRNIPIGGRDGQERRGGHQENRSGHQESRNDNEARNHESREPREPREPRAHVSHLNPKKAG